MLIKSLIQQASKSVIGREVTSEDLHLFRILNDCMKYKIPCKNTYFSPEMEEILKELASKSLLRYDMDNIVMTSKLYAYIINILEMNEY
jgi:hypothetical protein